MLKKMLSLKSAKPSLVQTNKEKIVAFLEQPIKAIVPQAEKTLLIAENQIVSKFIVQSTERSYWRRSHHALIRNR